MKNTRNLIFVLMLCLLLSGCALLAACANTPDALQALCDGAGLDLKAARFLSDDDSHGGFHGDGVRLAAVSFDAAADTARLADAEGWSALPLPEELAGVLYEGMEGIYPSDARIPRVEHGCWYFRDRFDPQSPDSGKPLAERGAYNFTAALYDADTQTLYYCEVDT